MMMGNVHRKDPLLPKTRCTTLWTGRVVSLLCGRYASPSGEIEKQLITNSLINCSPWYMHMPCDVPPFSCSSLTQLIRSEKHPSKIHLVIILSYHTQDIKGEMTVDSCISTVHFNHCTFTSRDGGNILIQEGGHPKGMMASFLCICTKGTKMTPKPATDKIRDTYISIPSGRHRPQESLPISLPLQIQSAHTSHLSVQQVHNLVTTSHQSIFADFISTTPQSSQSLLTLSVFIDHAKGRQ
jgi:hypothetical protein